MSIMFKYIYRIALLAIAIVGISSCSEHEEVCGDGFGNPAEEIIVSGTIDQHSQTRANDGGFVDKDAIGVYLVDYAKDKPGELLAQGNHVTNMKFTYYATTGLWKGTSKIYWTDENTPLDAFSYYPFQEIVDNPKSMPLTVLSRQDKDDDKTGFSNYEASDVLWAKAEKVEVGQMINFKFRHLMAGIELRLVSGEGFSDEEWSQLEKSVMVNNVLSEGTIDLSTGEITNNQDTRINIVPVDRGNAYRAVILPQTKSTGETLFLITVDGQSYQFKRSEDMTFVGHKLHKFTIQVTKRQAGGDYEFSLLDEAVTAWEDDGFSHGGEAREYIVIQSPVKGKLGEVLEASGYDLKQIYNLKIVGEMTGNDFEYIRNNITALEAINLKEVKLRDCDWGGSEGDNEHYNGDDILPKEAFCGCKNLKYFVFPNKVTKIGVDAFRGAGLLGALDIPEGVTHIGGSAFSNSGGELGDNLFLTSLKLPTTLEYIGGSAFRNNKFNNEFILPDKLRYVGEECFIECKYMTGELHLPSNLEEIGRAAFANLNNLKGKLVVPASLKVLRGLGGTGCNAVYLNEGLEIIEENALGGIGYNGQFETFSSDIRGELYVPNTVKRIDRGAFAGLQISHVRLPEGLTEIPRDLFRGCDKLLDTLKIPSTVKQIRSGAFSNCSRLTAIILPEGLESIGGDNSDCSWWQFPTFGGCHALNLIRCEAKVPPVIIGTDINGGGSCDPTGGVFDGLPKDNFTIEVPAGCVEAYRNAEGWKEFKRISEHNNFVCRPQFANLLNKGHKKDVVLNAEGGWTVDYVPSWCSVSAMSGNKKTQLTITIDELPNGAGTRQDSIVFKLTDKDAITCYYIKQYDSEYKEDASEVLQTATRGNGIDLVFIGDGYDAADIADGTYLADMRQEVEYFFGLEPYLSYREYFNVTTAYAMSEDSGIGTLNNLRRPKFGTTIDADRLQTNADMVMQYTVDNTSVTVETLSKSTVILIPNTNVYEGICYMYGDGSAVAVCPKSEADYPYDARGVLQHEAGGHAFGKFADEYRYHRAWIQTCPCVCCEHLDGLRAMQAMGWGQNLSISGRYKEIQWRHLAFDARYKDIVDIYEGGYFHTNGVYRSEANTCMNNNVPYYSSWCRELIVRRIKELSGETFDFEDFVAKDSREWGKDFTIYSRNSGVPYMFNTRTKGNAPVIINRKPKVK